MAKADDKINKYVNPLFSKFKAIAGKCKNKLSYGAYEDVIIRSSYRNIKFDSQGIFVRENANDKQMLFACLIIYVASVHIIIKNGKWDEFSDVVNFQYNLKRTLRSRYNNEFDDIFVYIGNLLFYGKKIMTNKIITANNIKKWKLIGTN